MNLITKFKKTLQAFQDSKNKIYFILQRKGALSASFAVLAIGFGLIGFYKHSNGLESFGNIIEALLRSIALFGFTFPTGEDFNFFTMLASLFAIITVLLTAVLFFFKDQINKQIFNNISKQEHIGIFGLGQIARTLLDSKDFDKQAVIVEQDSIFIEEYRAKGFGVKIGDAYNEEFLINTINFETMKYALIAFGEDRHNIEFAKKLISIYEKKNIQTTIKLIVHINDKALSVLFNKSFMLSSTEGKIQIKTFSYYEECASDLFRKHYIDGNSMRYMQSNETLHTILVGDGELLKRVIYSIVALSNFPNQNKHIITLVDPQAERLLKQVQNYIHDGIDNNRKRFPTIEIKALSLDYTINDFYIHKLWKESENIENIIICYDDESKNIHIGTALHEKVYLSDTIENSTIVPKILMGVFDELELSNAINDNTQDYINMFTFGSKNIIINSEYLLDETTDYISKLIHHGYGDQYNPSRLIDAKDILDKNWYNNAKISDKFSSIAQAKHIDMKLKAMGLQRVKSIKNRELLLKENRTLVDNILQNSGGPTDSELIKASQEIDNLYSSKPFKVLYWPEDFNENIFTKLLRAEHNRWNTHHYLEGWSYNLKKNKAKKEHNCLLLIAEFEEDDMRLTALYDCYSFLYLPNYLAESGYEIVLYQGEKNGK